MLPVNFLLTAGAEDIGQIDTYLIFRCVLVGDAVVETRIAPRYRVNKPAIAEYGGDKYPCIVRDLSVTGAAVEFPELVSVIPIAKDFVLVVPVDRLKLPCRIVWKKDYRMGVSFD